MAPLDGSTDASADAGPTAGGAHRARVDGLLRGRLEPRPDRRVDLQAAAPHRGEPVATHELAAHQVEDVRLAYARVVLRRVQPEPGAEGARQLAGADVSLRAHRPQHLVAPLPRQAGMHQRVVVRRRLRQAGEQRRLAQRQPAGGRGEVGLGGRLDSDRGQAAVGPIGGRVQVLGEDRGLRVAGVLLIGQMRLDDLALERVARVLDVEVADQLLGDRRAALDGLAAREQVAPARADDRLRVDPALAVEVPILDRHRRLP